MRGGAPLGPPLAIYSSVAAGDAQGAFGYVLILLAVSLLTLLAMGALGGNHIEKPKTERSCAL